MAVGEDVYCTSVMSDNYLPGAAVLAHSLRDAGTTKKLAVMVTLDSVRATTMTELKSLYDYVFPVDRISNPNPSNSYLMNRSDLLYAFTKINVWRLTQFRKVVFVDADVVALRAPDESFDIKEDFAAAPDVGFPDFFNTGVMALKPHMGEYWALRTSASSGDSFDGADQGLLNQYYEHKNWHRSSFNYNCTPSANYQYEPAYRYNKSKITMVHFIGKSKPWMESRTMQGSSGAHKESLNRWWAVYDRHLRAPTSEYMSGQYAPASGVVQSQVHDDAANVGTQAVQPEATVTTTDAPFTESGEPAEMIDQGIVEPTPTVEQRRFSAPHMEWDATKMPPPADAKPEAVNFPSQTYVFNEDPELFRPPQSYPEPPKDMWFKVPEEKPLPPAEKPKPIFPWEEREEAKPTRIFLEDIVQSQPTPTEEEASPEPITPVTPTIKITQEDPWQSFGAINRNAWDEVSGIDEYVRALSDFQRTRGKVQVVAPVGVGTPEFTPSRERRESLLLTDFPTAVERPSSPVTPAPMRPNFWGKERDEEGNSPPAEGVPDQADWDPSEKLEESRRNSLIDASDSKSPKNRIPRREMPGSSAPIPEEALNHPHVPVSEGSSPHGLDEPSAPEAPVAGSSTTTASTSATTAPSFSVVDFAATTLAPEEKKEDVLSPTEHGSRHF